MSSKEEFVQWKQHPVTKAVIASMQARVDYLKDQLAMSAGVDPLEDRFRVGYIAAANDFSDIDFVDKEDA